MVTGYQLQEMSWEERDSLYRRLETQLGNLYQVGNRDLKDRLSISMRLLQHGVRGHDTNQFVLAEGEHTQLFQGIAKSLGFVEGELHSISQVIPNPT